MDLLTEIDGEREREMLRRKDVKEKTVKNDKKKKKKKHYQIEISGKYEENILSKDERILHLQRRKIKTETNRKFGANVSKIASADNHRFWAKHNLTDQS